MADKKFITCDGNYAAAHVAYMFSEVAAIYPITPSSPMAEYIDEWAAFGRKNIFNETVRVVEMQSEGGAAGAVHGSLQAGALTATYTASQGLLLMIPNMYKIAGELLPGVFHVSARSLAAQALSIFGDHSDVMSARQTGFAMLATSSVQEIMDLAPVAHLAAIKGRIPFIHFFDGFRTSHEIQKVEAAAQDDLEKLIDRNELAEFRKRALNPEHPVTRGTAQNPDIYFQTREAQNKFYDAIPDIVADYMLKISRLTGRKYAPFTYYGAPDATDIIVAMGSITEVAKTVVDKLNLDGGKTGVITVHLYRPFSVKYLSEVIPETVKRICVLDRTKEHGANGDPLYLDIVEAFSNSKNITCDKKPLITGGRYGLSSKDTTPAHILAVFNNMNDEEPKNQFTIGINDDVTNRSLPLLPDIVVLPEGTFEAKFYGLGADGTVGANKNSIKIIGDNTEKYSQAYFDYDSKKSGGYTCSHLRFGDKQIQAPYLVNTPDFVAVHVPSYLKKYDCLKGLKHGGTFLYNSPWSIEETKNNLPDSVKKYLAVNSIQMYIINATDIAQKIGLGNRTNTILQSAFFKISQVISYGLAVKQMKKAIEKSYGRKGENIVNMNYSAIDEGGNVIKIDIPAEWANIELTKQNDERSIPDFIKNIVEPVNSQKGNDLPVSAFSGYEDGTFPAGTAAYEKRGIAVNVPAWQAESCIQCNQCSFVCPHAAIRPVVMTDDELKNAPKSMNTLDMKVPKELAGMHFRIQVSVLDCTGCGNCADICPSKTKALYMQPVETQAEQIDNWTYSQHNVTYKDNLIDKTLNLKNSQFAQPLFEFSGACAGCGETPYIKAITQLFGEQMLIANATGCSSIYGGSAPSTPYCKNYRSGFGPAWANSLFEDNAEYGLGMAIATRQMRDRVLQKTQALIAVEWTQQRVKDAAQAWLDTMNDGGNAGRKAADEYIAALEWGIMDIDGAITYLESAGAEYADKLAEVKAKKAAGATTCECPACTLCKELLELKQYFVKKSQWIFGGDGWAYDIGFGGLDHVLASGENINILVLDTEVYSNTGGQSSKATPAGAVAKFATSGKKIRKKDLGMIAKSYGYVYVAQVAMGASQVQYLKAIKEAEAFNGPSIVICYAPCISHGIKAGMSCTQLEEKRAVECGYWHLWRYNPDLEAAGQNGFVLDSREPDWSKFQDFIKGEIRYSSLLSSFPQEAAELFDTTQQNALWRYSQYKRLAAGN
ncbi:MAG: pyruvate:ferredoxin (flavodoxin) oxidoreductase [Prevotellaceae bacterium]|jgi:pyruvate-ferredoxin/flavodoxin oxidoreductase|nr:pyruvate:ferredoxin (flavodoxin) oxidoreductase [Prevotellaceae bacterium]